MSLDDLMRIRAEPELRQKLAALAAVNHKRESQLVREILWSYIEEQERAEIEMNDRPSQLRTEASGRTKLPVNYKKPRRRSGRRVEEDV